MHVVPPYVGSLYPDLASSQAWSEQGFREEVSDQA